MLSLRICGFLFHLLLVNYVEVLLSKRSCSSVQISALTTKTKPLHALVSLEEPNHENVLTKI